MELFRLYPWARHVVPRSKDFIRENPRLIERMKEVEIDPERRRIVVLESDLLGFEEPHFGAQGGNAVIFDYEKGVYYRVIWMARGMDEVSDFAFKCLALHEWRELALREGILRSRMLTERDSVRIHKRAWSWMERKMKKEVGPKEYEERLISTGYEVVEKVHERAGRKATSSGFLTYWIGQHIKQNQERYTEYQIPMTKAMKSKKYRERREEVRRRVEEILELTLSPLKWGDSPLSTIPPVGLQARGMASRGVLGCVNPPPFQPL